MKAGDIVAWSNHDDEPELRGKVLEVDEEFDYLKVAYVSLSGRNMCCLAPSKNFRFVMGPC